MDSQLAQRILIVGCGIIGNSVGIQLHQQGNIVHGIRRQASLIAKCISPLSIDLNLPLTQWEKSLPKADKILISLTPNSRSPKGYTQCYIHNIEKIITHYNKQSAKFYFLSSTAVYGENQKKITTQSPIEPSNWKGQVLAQAEKKLLENTDACIMNSAGIYGMMRWWLFDYLNGKKSISLNLKKISNRIHQQDLINFITQCILTSNHLKRYILCDDYSCPYHEIIDWLQHQHFPVATHIKEEIKQLSKQPIKFQSKLCKNNIDKLANFKLNYPTYKEGFAEQLPFWLGWQKMTPFQQKVLNKVAQIPWGETTSYRKVGDTINCRAYRAIGQVLRKNPCAPWIPCHRVIANNGTIGGFMGEKHGTAIEEKKRLLAQENIIL